MINLMGYIIRERDVYKISPTQGYNPKLNLHGSVSPSWIPRQFSMSLNEKHLVIKKVIRMKSPPRGTKVRQTTYTSFKYKQISMIVHLSRRLLWTQGGLSNGPKHALCVGSS